MTFQAPPLLLALLLVPAAIALYVRHERAVRRGMAAFAPPALLASVLPRRAGWRRHLPAGVYALAVAGLIVALARPEATVAVPAQQATVMVVTDRSGSMRAEDVAPNRLAAARRAVGTFLDTVPDGVRVGAVAFSSAAEVLHSPTRDRDAVRRAVSRIEAKGTTATGEGLDAALRAIRAARQADAQETPAAIVLLSDGTSDRGRDPLAVAVEARAAGIPIHTVALGTDSGTIETRDASGAARTAVVPPDRATMRQIAERSGGLAFDVRDAARLREAYERLGSEFAEEERRQEVTGMVAGGALLLLAAAAMASLRWFGRFV